MRIDPLLTLCPQTGAIRHVTDDLLREVYLAPAAKGLDLADHLQGRIAPWSESFAAAPDDTARAVEAGINTVARATNRLDPGEIDLSTLPEGRARIHLVALRDTWHDIGRLPEPLATWGHILRCAPSDALEQLPLLDPAPCAFADQAEVTLAETLLTHHGAAPGDALETWRVRQPTRNGMASGALGHIQSNLGRASETVNRDASLACFGLRDPREEAEFAAAHAQRMLDDGVVAMPQEIGLLVPEDNTYGLALGEAFERVGLSLSGLPAHPACRDTSGELLSLLLALLEGPAPRTATASLYVSPLMPWPRETGRRMAREVIDRGWSRTAADLSGSARVLLDALRPCSTPEQLFARLGAVAKCAPEAGLYPRIAELRGVAGETIDWPLLCRLAAPRPVAATGHERFVEGVSLFVEPAIPWRPVRQLIVLGLAGRHWPRPTGADLFFTESEVALIRGHTGLALPGRQRKLARGLELFRRQLCAATECATLLVPACDLRGETLPPSTGLALIAHMLGAKEPNDLVHDIRADSPLAWPVSADTPSPVPEGGAPDLPQEGRLHLGSDLFRLRDDDEGSHAPQSPSRLETLIVSPLAWLLEELGARDRTWAPEELDVMTLGTILHHVLEVTFVEGADIPDTGTIAATVPEALDAAIHRHAPWLSGPSWMTERRSLQREAQEVAAAWAGFLTESGAEVLHNEIELNGDHGGLLLTGKADCLLRLKDGRILVVDHKRSRSAGRRDRMAKGWDLQVALYRAMLERPSEETALTKLVSEGAQVVTAYHTMLDSTVLSDAAGAGLPRVESAGEDASARAMVHLAQVVAEVGAGTIRLNRTGDAKTFAKDRGIKAYALEGNPFVEAFTLPEEDTE